MTRRVFFSFHYDDVASFRANVVRNSGAITGSNQAGFFDASIWEEAKRTSDLSIKRLINQGLENTSVTCVLIGSQTYDRHWVRYEILKSIERGNGLLGVHINGIADKYGKTKTNGPNPFNYLKIEPSKYQYSSKEIISEWKGGRWCEWEKSDFLVYGSWNNDLSSYFPVYDWVANYGQINFSHWIEKAAKVAGR